MSVLELHTLNGCGCVAKVYSDGSGVDIEYCKLHNSVDELVSACRTALARLSNSPDDEDRWIANIIRQALKSSGKY